VPCSTDLLTFRNGTDGYATLEDAMRDLEDGDVLTLCPGTYDEPIATRGTFTLESSAGPEVTTIRGTTTLPALEVVTGSVEISGLSFTHGGGLNVDGERYGGAIFVSEEASLVFRSSRATDNSADFGGAIYAGGEATLTLVDAVLEANEAYQDGGAVLSSGFTTLQGTHFLGNISGQSGAGLHLDDLSGSDSSLDITDCHFEGNSAGDDGGGVYADIDVTVTDSTFTANLAVGSGGGLDTHDLTLSGSTLSANVSEGSGGGLYASDLDSRDSLITDNTAFYGGGLHASNATLTSTTVSGNSSSSTGAGIRFGDSLALVDSSVTGNIGGYNGGGVYSTDLDLLTLANSVIENNHAEQGAGLYVSAGSWSWGEVICDAGSVIRGNHADQGGTWDRGGGMYGSDLTVSGCTFDGNSADEGGGLWFEGDLVDVEITGNTAATEAGGLFISSSSGGSFTNVGITGNTAGVTASAVKDWGYGAEFANCDLTGNSSPDGIVMELDVGWEGYTLSVEDTQFDPGSTIRLSAWGEPNLDVAVPGPTFTCTPSGC